MIIPAPKLVTSGNTTATDLKKSAIKFRQLQSADGMALHQLINACPPLDSNSAYCNLLQCSHFKNTSIAAFVESRLIGSVTGYLIPEHNDTLFIWQVAVHPSARGNRLASDMLNKLLEMETTKGVRFIETSITPENEASSRLFVRLAKDKNTEIKRSVLFDKIMHFMDEHDTEYLYRIGPLQ